jgi:hypothetical protein
MILKNMKVGLVMSPLLLVACTTVHHGALENASTQSQVQKRDYQSRVFDTTDKLKVLQSVVATLQDLDFVVNKADTELGMISATKFDRNSEYSMTVTVRSRGNKQVLVRANASHGVSPVEDPKAFQNFFRSLGQAMFLDAREI